MGGRQHAHSRFAVPADLWKTRDMTVYVDDPVILWRGRRWAHLMADTLDELHAMAAQLGLPGLRPVQTVVEKRATFACRPGVKRPGLELGHGLWACGDYVNGPYPATLEGAVRCALEAAEQLVRKD